MRIYKTKSGETRFQASIRLNNGKRLNKSFSRKTDGRIWLATQVKEKAASRSGIATVDPILFKELADRWFQKKVLQKTASATEYMYSRVLESTLKPHLGDYYSDQLTHKDCEDLIEGLSRDGLKPKTVNRVVTLLGQVINFGIEEGNIVASPIKRKLRMRETAPRFEYYSDSEIRALLASNNREDIYPILYLAIHTGMRLGEILGLCWDRVNFMTNQIEISRTQVATGLQETTKGKRTRYFPMNPSLRSFFLDLRSRQRDERYVFTSQNGSAFNAEHFCKRQFKPACERANVRCLRFHDLRHSFASHFMMNGGDVFTLKELLGHSDISTTMIYAHLSPKHLEKASEIVNFNAGGAYLAHAESGISNLKIVSET